MPDHPGSHRLLVVLHGHGDDPAELLDRLAPLDLGSHVTLVAPTGPVTLADGRPAWFDDGSEADTTRLLAHLRDALDEAGRTTGLPSEEAVVLGYSQGAAAALTLAAADAAPRVAAVAGIAGWLPTLDGLTWTPRPDVDVLLVHGVDDEVVPLPLGRSAARFLERGGVAVTWCELDADHAVGPDALELVAAWLAERLDVGPA